MTINETVVSYVLVHSVVLGRRPLVFILFAIKFATERTNAHAASNGSLGGLGRV